MRRFLRKLLAASKGIIFLLKPHIIFGFLAQPLFFLANLLRLSKWISKQNKSNISNDFFSFKRDYKKRYSLYKNVIQLEKLKNESLIYLEFGVYTGSSYKWWVNELDHPETKFYGFDTFEGLPENWGTYRKGEMDSGFPQVEGFRHKFLKGLFQDTLHHFIEERKEDLINHRLVINMDADLYSSTLFVLTSLGPCLKPGDIIFFDEFNVPNHEFLALKNFSESYYKDYTLLGAVNNFYQIAIKMK